MKKELLLLHGALGSTQQFIPLKPFLEQNFELYEMNFEGHGPLPSNNEFSIQLFTDNVKEFLETEQLSAMNIFGYSMGGYVALNLALQSPQLVDKVLTFGTKFDWSPEAAEKETKMLIPEKIEEKVPHFAEKLKAEHAPQDWKELMHKTAKMMEEMGKGKHLRPDELRQIRQRVQIGWGSKDKMVSREESIEASKELQNGHFIELEDFPHPIDRADPGLLAQFIRNALESD